MAISAEGSGKKTKKSKKKSAEKEVVVDEVEIVEKKSKKRKKSLPDETEEKVKKPKKVKVSEEEKEKSPSKKISKELETAKKNSVTFDDDDEGKEESVDDAREDDPGALENFKISDYIKDKLKKMGVVRLFPVQYESFKYISEGQDLILQARTGSGKTLSFALPVVEMLNTRGKAKKHTPSVLVLAPTRELSKQVADCFEGICTHSIKVLCVYGGTPIYPQEKALKDGVDIVVGTPGRVQDLINRGSLVLNDLTHVILDEVDRMLDMGFAQDVDQILNLRYSGMSCSLMISLLNQ